MLDPQQLRRDTAGVAQQLLRRRYTLDVEVFSQIEADRKTLQGRQQVLQKERNRNSKEIGRRKACGEDVSEMLSTMQQVRDELRDAEGDPESRRRRRQRALQDAGARHVDASARVRILLVAPGPVAVLIEHDRAGSSSPMVLAGGRGDAARRLQQEATVASTPIIESGLLAIELHEQVASGERVPEHLFRGIAEVLAGVYRDSGSGAP